MKLQNECNPDYQIKLNDAADLSFEDTVIVLLGAFYDLTCFQYCYQSLNPASKLQINQKAKFKFR